MADTFTKDWRRLEQDCASLEHRLEQAEAILQTNEEQIKGAVKEATEKDERTRQLTSAIADRDQRITRLQDHNAQLRRDTQSLKEAVQRLSGENESSEKLLHEQNATIKRLLAAQQAQQHQIQSLTTKAREQDAEIARMIRSKTQLQEQLQIGPRRTAEPETKTVADRTKMPQTNRDLQQAERIMLEVQGKLDQRAARISRLEQGLRQLARERDRFVGRLEQAEARVKELEHLLPPRIESFLRFFLGSQTPQQPRK